MTRKTKSTTKTSLSEPCSLYRSFNKNSSFQMNAVLLTGDYIEKINDDQFVIDSDNESSSLLPSTPVYSDIMNNNNSVDCEEVGPTKKRFLVIAIVSITFFLQVFSQSIWSAIYEPALLAFPDWDSRSLSLLPIWGSLMSTVLVFPACFIINKFGQTRSVLMDTTTLTVTMYHTIGLKMSLFMSSLIFTLGTLIRCLPFIRSSTLCLHLSAVCLSSGGVFMTPLIITMSAQWFPKNERNMATGFGSTVGMLGNAATYVIGPMVVSTTDQNPIYPYLMRCQIMRMLYACFAMNMMVLFVIACFPKRTRPVSYTSKQSMVSHQSAKLLHSLKVLFSDYDMWCLVLAFTLPNTMSFPWVALLPSTFSKLRVPPELSANCGLFMIIHTFALSLSISKFADGAPGYSKEFAIFCRIVSSGFLFWLMLMMNFDAKLTTTNLVCAILMAFPYSWCTQSVFYEMGTELMFPLPESFVAGYMTFVNNLFVDVVYLVLYMVPYFDKYWIHIGVLVFSVLSFIFLLLTVDRTKKKYTCIDKQ